MHTLGYRFRPWSEGRSLADGASILDYVRRTSDENGITGRIRFGHRVVRAEWSSEDARWSVEAERSDGERVNLTCGFLHICSGYYRYDEGFTPEFEGVDRFAGRVIHPQHWPDDVDYAGKRAVVIGSGATAVTLVPALAKSASKVTMLQRSPTYIVSLPGEDPIAKALDRLLPSRAVSTVVRWKNVLLQMFVYSLARRRPKLVRRLVRRGVERKLPEGFDVDTHFEPRYDPWDQRLCLVPDDDLFEAISDGRADVVTDRIEAFTERGLKLESGRELEADLIVTATGLNLLFLGGMEIVVDGSAVDPATSMTYKGMMLSGVPNMTFTIGYTNASWTLKADLVAEYTCRLLEHMDAGGYASCVPAAPSTSVHEVPLIDFNSGYVLRSLNELPKQGSESPWRLRQNYPLDLRELRHGPIDDGTMVFSRRAVQERPAERAAA
jgi:cation diffusion facilitator CzcD-associated flavoprotein CzcO